MNNNLFQQNLDTIKKILFAAKLKSGKFFTQIPTKKFYKKNILTQSNKAITSSIIDNGDYTVEAFGSLEKSITNYLDSQNLNVGDTALVHPFTPIVIVDSLKKSGLQIIFYDIEPNTLSIQKESFENKVKLQNPKTVIHYTINQLLQEVQDQIEFLDNNKVSILVVDNNTTHNDEYFGLINAMKNGTYIQLLSENFYSNMYKDIVGIEVSNTPIYLSLNIGLDLLNTITTKEVSNTQLHAELADTIYQILFNKVEKNTFVNSIKNTIIKNTLSSQKNLTPSQLQESVEQIYNVTNNDMIPDYIFELINTLSVSVDNQTQTNNANILKNQNSKKLKIKNLLDNDTKNNTGLVVSEDCIIRESTAFYFASDDAKYWYNSLKLGGVECYRLPSPHDDLFNYLDDNLNDLINNTLVTIL